MNAVELEKVVTKSGRSARSLSIALGKDASYISSMIKRGYEIPASVAKKLKDLIAGKEVPSFDFKAEDFDSARLDELVRRRQVNVAALAQRVGVGRATVYKWCKGQGSPRDEDSARALAKELGVSVDFLYGFGTVEDNVKAAANSADGAQPVQRLKQSVSKERRLVAVFLEVEAFDKVKGILEMADPNMTHRPL